MALLVLASKTHPSPNPGRLYGAGTTIYPSWSENWSFRRSMADKVWIQSILMIDTKIILK